MNLGIRLAARSACAAPAPRGAWRGTMARSRRVAGCTVLRVVLAGVLLSLASCSLVALSNSVVGERRRIEGLQQEKDYLEAKLGRLEQRWNRASARENVVARAETELGLITPDAPGTNVVLIDRPAKERQLAVLDRILAAVGGGGGSIATATAGERRP